MEDQNKVGAIDKDGKEVEMTKEQWEKEILPTLLEKAGDNPNMLYGIIALAADNGMAEAVVETCRKAHELDAIPERGATTYAIILTKAGRLDEARQVLEKYISEYGKTDIILTSMARILILSGDIEKAVQALHDALEINPNNEKAVEWLADHYRETEGPDAEKKVLEKLSERSGSWRCLIWLGHRDVEAGNKTGAIEYYNQAIEASNSDSDALTIVAGDLLQNGHVLEMIRMMEECYDVKKHGINPGWSLVNGYLQTGQKRTGIALLNQLEDCDRPDLTAHFDEMRKSLAKLPDEN